MVPQQTGVAVSVDADAFATFARSLPCGIDGPAGHPLVPSDVVDFDLCWAYDLVDPWGNLYELNCYEYERIKADLIAADQISPTRYWPAELHADHPRRSPPAQACPPSQLIPLPWAPHPPSTNHRSAPISK